MFERLKALFARNKKPVKKNRPSPALDWPNNVSYYEPVTVRRANNVISYASTPSRKDDNSNDALLWALAMNDMESSVPHGHSSTWSGSGGDSGGAGASGSWDSSPSYDWHHDSSSSYDSSSSSYDSSSFSSSD